MMPNKKTKDWQDSIMFECECSGQHYLIVTHDKDDKPIDDSLWFEFIDYPSSLWQILKIWWRQRKVWISEIQLTPNDVKELIKALNRYLETIKKKK